MGASFSVRFAKNYINQFLTKFFHKLPTLKPEYVARLILKKSGKSAGPDNIPPEALKHSMEESTELLHSLFEKIWQEGDVPKEWKDGYIVKIPKKGDLHECSN